MDLSLYLNDRKKFLDEVFFENPAYFLTLNTDYELDLIGHYKINENKLTLSNGEIAIIKIFGKNTKKSLEKEYDLENWTINALKL